MKGDYSKTDAFIRSKSHEDVFNQLTDDILEQNLQPQDYFEIAALLESMGWSDHRAAREFGVEDIFELASQIWDAIQFRIVYTPFAMTEKQSFQKMTYEMFKNFLRGLIFAFPMAISVIAMLNLKFSLWSYQYLSLEQATSIAIGTILSFILVGGFTQAIARRGFFYIIQGYYNLAKQSTFIFIRIGFALCGVIAVLLVFFNLIFSMFNYSMIFLIVVFFVFLTAIWLSVTVMYILKKEIIFTLLIILGIVLVYLFFQVLGINIIISQLISLSIISICSTMLVMYYFKQYEKKIDKGQTFKLPRFSITTYSVWPYFLYGFLYFTFLFVDRVNAWSKNEEFMPYIIWFRGEYELGLDFALLTLIIPMGISEVIVSKLMLDIEANQKNYLVIDSDKLYKKFLSSYRIMHLFILISSVISAYIIYQVTLWYNKISIEINGQNLLNNEITPFVLFWGIISYIVLAMCLMNAVILFSLSQPNLVIQAILPALLINVSIGFLLSRWFGHEYAVFGLLIGAVVMQVLSTISLTKVLKNIDYYLYAAS